MNCSTCTSLDNQLREVVEQKAALESQLQASEAKCRELEELRSQEDVKNFLNTSWNNEANDHRVEAVKFAAIEITTKLRLTAAEKVIEQAKGALNEAACLGYQDIELVATANDALAAIAEYEKGKK